MSQPFIEFLEGLETRNRAGEFKPAKASSGRDTTKQDDYHVSNPDILPNDRYLRSGRSPSKENVSLKEGDPKWDEVKRSSRIGPLLSTLRAEHEKQPAALRESYSIEHLKRLYQFVPRRAYERPRSSELCSKVHPKPCPYGCKSCHFCRQRTTEIKTVCSVCEGVNNYYGGPARGYWCGSCLWLRIGENIDEVRQLPDWICPGCRDICNCSGANCMRIKRGWFPTQQLSHEAREQGYKSVAHYLVLTHLSEECNPAPQVMPGKPCARSQAGNTVLRNHQSVSPRMQRKRTGELLLVGQTSRRQKLESVSKMRLQTEVAAILKDIDGVSNFELLDESLQEISAKASGKVFRAMSNFLCILDKDIKESDEPFEQAGTISLELFSSKVLEDTHVKGNVPQILARGSIASAQHNVPSEQWHIPIDLLRHERTPSMLADNSRGHHTEVQNHDTDYKSAIARDSRSKTNEIEGNMLHKVTVRNLPPGNRHMGKRLDSSQALDGYQINNIENTYPNFTHKDEQHNENWYASRGTMLERASGQMRPDEFIWNNLCTRATSILESIRTFHNIYLKSQNAIPLDLEIDEKIYQSIIDSSLPMLQSILRFVEGLLLEEYCILYTERLHSDVLSSQKLAPGSLRTIEGLKRAVQLLTFLSRLLPINDIRWRIERRLMGIEPFVNFDGSSPHAKAILLKGRIEFAVILERRGLPNHQVLAIIGESLASIALDMQRLLPYLDAILKGVPLPDESEAISGWHYDQEIRKKKVVEIFGDLSVLYASLQGVLLVSLGNIIDLCDILGLKAQHILTENFILRLLARENVYPCTVTRQVLLLICRILCTARRQPLLNDDCGMTLEDQNFFFQETDSLVAKVYSLILPQVESLVKEEYRMWGSNKDVQWLKDDEALHCNTKERVGSEKVEVVARCYALLVRKGILTWNAVETKATEPYSFEQFWKHANITYRHFAVYLLTHTIHNAPCVLGKDINLPRILHVWLLSILDYGKHQCSWYLTSILSGCLREFFPSNVEPDYNFLNDDSGSRRAALLKYVVSALASSPKKSMIADMIHDLDQFLLERQKEIIQTAVNSENALPLWQKSASRAVIGLLHGLMPLHLVTGDAGRQVQKLLRLCSFWIVESCYQLRSRLQGPQSHQGQASSVAKEQATAEAEIRQYLGESTFDIVHDVMPLIESLRIHCSSVDHKEYLEPLWIIISGCIEFGEAGTDVREYEYVIYDKIASSIISCPEIGTLSGFVPTTDAKGSPLQVFVLATFVRRYLWRATYRHSINEAHAINALRLALAIMARSEMRAKSMFEAAFNTMIPMCLYVLMRAGDQELLSLRNAMLSFFSFCVKQQPSIVPCKLQADYSPTVRVWQSFWASICRECLSAVRNRFPTEIHSAVSVDAEIFHSKLLLTTPDLGLFLPITSESLAETYNLALSLMDGSSEFQLFEALICQINVSELSRVGPSHGPRDFPTKVLQQHRNLNWMLAKASISFLIDLLDAECANAKPQDESLSSRESKPILKFSLACLPYLRALISRGGNASILIEEYYTKFVVRLKQVYPNVQNCLTEPCNPVDPQPVGMQLDKDSYVVRNSADISRLEVGAIFEFVGYLSRIRTIERKGVQVVVCSLSTDHQSRGNVLGNNEILSISLNLLVSKPKSLVSMLLELEKNMDSPKWIRLEHIELVRQNGTNPQPSEHVAVARALSSTRIFVGTYEPLREQDENPRVTEGESIFAEALGHLTGMGYEQKASEDAIMRIRGSNHFTHADAAAIVARAVEHLVKGT